MEAYQVSRPPDPETRSPATVGAVNRADRKQAGEQANRQLHYTAGKGRAASAEAYHGTRQPILDFIAETMASARIQTELALTYAEIGDVIGLKYAMRNLIAHVRAAAPLLKEFDALAQEVRR